VQVLTPSRDCKERLILGFHTDPDARDSESALSNERHSPSRDRKRVERIMSCSDRALTSNHLDDKIRVDADRAGQYITFRVARQDFAMSATCVRGLLPIHDVTSLDPPHPWIAGVAAIHGHEFPVIDLPRKLGLAAGRLGRNPCVIVIEIAGARLIGFVADRVSEVVAFRDRDFRDGCVRVNGRLRPVLDPNSILSQEERPATL